MGYLRYLILQGLIFGSLNSQSQNLAMNKSYTLSPSPNYRSSIPSSDKCYLTDGDYTNGFFWSQPTTVGWQNCDKIRIDIDLEKDQPIGGITFSTARSMKSKVSFPSNIYVFLSNDNKHFIYSGDAADNTDNQAGGYEVKKFFLNNINQIARFVSLIVIPKGLFVFCDEIEVTKGINKSSSPSKSNWISNLDSALDSLKTTEFNRMGKTHAAILGKNYKTSFIVEKYNPWDTLTQIHEPKGNNDLLNYQLLIPVNGVQYGAFVLTNNHINSRKFEIYSLPSPSNYNIEIFNAIFVASGRFVKSPDALIPFKQNITIGPGKSELLIFKITGKKIGIINSSIRISTGKKAIYAKISGKIFNLFSLNNKDQLNSINWAYLNSPMLQDRKTEAAKDLELHHINTVVIPPTYIPKMHTDYKSFLSYLAYFKDVDNLLLFTNYASKENYKQFGPWMSSEFKNNFVIWYHELITVLKGNGFSNSQIYLYPFDEIREGAIDRFKKFASWAKIAIPTIKIYSTLNNKDAIDNILPLVDIAQIPSNLNLLSRLPSNHCEIWIYSTASSSRSLSPYLYYRMMAWKAFANSITGIGFWDYADEGRRSKLNEISDSWNNHSNSSYSVIYNGPEKEIISSRRWEAFRLGIEDYSIIKAYAKKVGQLKAKALVNKVLSDPTDPYKADSVRNEMIFRLVDNE